MQESFVCLRVQIFFFWTFPLGSVVADVYAAALEAFGSVPKQQRVWFDWDALLER